MNWVIKLIDSHKQDAELDPFTIDEAVKFTDQISKLKRCKSRFSSKYNLWLHFGRYYWRALRICERFVWV